MKTTRATEARRAKYDAAALAAHPSIRAARLQGAKNSADFAAYLNSNGIVAPSGSPWTKDAILRVLRHLKSLDLDPGSLKPQYARSWDNKRNARRAYVDSSRLEKHLPAEARAELRALFAKMQRS